MNKVHYSSKKDDWRTPRYLFDYLNDQFKFTLDPCASDESALCEKYYTKETDGLAQSWAGERVFMNPPYGNQIEKWVNKAEEESENCFIIALLPARTDTDWFHEYCAGRPLVFLNKRVWFVGCSDHGAPFPSMIVKFSLFDKNNVEFISRGNGASYKTFNHKKLINRDEK